MREPGGDFLASVERTTSLDAGLSRRQLLKGAAAGASSLALAGGLAELLAACGGTSSSGGSQAIGPDTTGTLTVWPYATSNDVKAEQAQPGTLPKQTP